MTACSCLSGWSFPAYCLRSCRYGSRVFSRPTADAPAAEMEPGSPGGGGGSSWISQHVWVPIVGAVGGLVLLGSGLAFCVLPLLGISVLGRLCS